MKRLVLISLCVILWALATAVRASAVNANLAEDAAVAAPATQAHAAEPRPIEANAVSARQNIDNPGFSYRVVGKAHLMDGTELPIDKAISFAKDARGWFFRLGDQRIYRNTPPRAYYLNIILDGQHNAYIPDISDTPLSYLHLTIEDWEIELVEAPGADTTYGMRLRINERQFLFESRHPRIRFAFTEQGLATVSTENTIRDLSIRRVQ